MKPRIVHEGRGGYVAIDDARYPIDHVDGGRFAIHFPAGNRAGARRDVHLVALVELCAADPQKWALEATPASLLTVIAATRVHLVVDDREGLSSFHACSASPPRHVALARGADDELVHCELDDQANGFDSETIRYFLASRTLRFVVTGRERFDAKNEVCVVDVRLPEKTSVAEVKACLEAIFAIGRRR
jgi:hypothetical protein